MEIACPACDTRYAVPDSAIGLEGRSVRCAKCKQSWFQNGPGFAEPIAAAYGAPEPRQDSAPPPPAPAPAPPPVAPPPPPAPRPVRAEEQPESRAEAIPEEAAAPLSDADPYPQGPEDDAPRGRGWMRIVFLFLGALVALAVAGAAVIAVWGLPSWLPFGHARYGPDPGLTVEFPQSEQERRTLPNGAEFFGARVTVRNETRETKTVPPLLIVLYDARDRAVYSWELVPPQRTLAPGEEETINEAMVDVPKSAVSAEIGWAPR